MRLCIATTDDRGLEAPVAGHFGRAPWFTFLDLETGALDLEANPDRLHESGACRTPEAMERRGVEAVICRSLGQHALDRMKELGIAVFAPATRCSVAQAVAAYRRQRE